MKTFPSAFAAELAKQTGIAPVWLIKLTASGSDYYISDDAFSIPVWNGGITTLPWISTWGEVREALSGALNEIRVTDLDLTLLVDPDASPSMADLATDTALETSPVSLYLWFRGLNPATDPPQEMRRFYVDAVELPDETEVRLVLQDETIKLDGYVGSKVDLELYPEADPDDVGKVIPIPFGTVNKLPALAVDAGVMTNLPNSINAIMTDFAVSDAAGLTVGDILQVDEERLLIGAIVGDQLTCSRGHDLTVAVVHQRGAIAWQIKNQFVYIASALPVDSLNKIYGRVGDAEVDITAIATCYTGQPGDELPGYAGYAVVVLPGYITIGQAVDLLLSDGLSILDTLSLADSIGVSDTIGVSDLMTILNTLEISDTIGVSDLMTILNTLGISDTISVYDTIAISNGIVVGDNISLANGNHSHTTTLYNTKEQYGSAIPQTSNSGSNVSVTPTFSYPGGTVIDGTYEYSWSWKLSGGSGTVTIRVNGAVQSGSSWIGSVSGSTTPAITGTVSGTGSLIITVAAARRTVSVSGSISATNVTKAGAAYSTGTVDRSGTITSTGDVTQTGTVDRSGTITSTGTVDKTGTVTLSGSVTKTGAVTLSGNSTANTLVGDSVLVNLTRTVSIHQAFDDLLSPLGFPPLQITGSLPVGYALNGAITEYQTALNWLDAWAFQLRCWFKITNGQPRLILRPDSLTSSQTITMPKAAAGKKIWSRRKVERSEILNKIHLLFNRDWRQARSDSAYQGISKASDLDSISKYGEREQPELFLFDFVTDPALADSLRDFYLAHYATRRWIHEFEVFLDHSALEFGDAVTLAWDGDKIGQISEARHSPGDINKIDTIGLVVVV